ncbi:unnamed protein product [Sympodiomycopsis kandeliae]
MASTTQSKDEPTPAAASPLETSIEHKSTAAPFSGSSSSDSDVQEGEKEDLRLSEKEKASILARVDWNLVPYFSLLYLLSFLDRVNIGQANVAGLSQALHLQGNEYAVATSLFFVSYVAFEIPSNWLLKAMKPHRYIPVIMVAWGVVMTLMGIVQNAAGLQAARFFLGLAEGGLFPGINFLLTNWYPRSKQGLRIGLFFSFSTLSGAFGGILAFALKQIQAGAYDTPLQGWRWIFIIEGLLTVVCAVPGWWIIADFPTDKNRFITPLEARKWVRHIENSQGVTSAQIPFSRKQVMQAFKDWKLYVYSLMYLSVANPLYSLALFTPQIIQDLKFTGASANLMSVPPYVLGFLTTVVSAFLSDRFLVRAPFLVFWMGIVTIGYIILICDVSAGVKYFALFLTVSGSAPSIATCITFIGGNYGPVYTRATAMGLFFMAGNSAGLISSNVYPKTDSPRYTQGHSINLAFSAIAIVCAIVLAIANIRENKRRDALYGRVDARKDGGGSTTDASGTSAEKGEQSEMARLTSPEEKKRWGLEGKTDLEVMELGDRHPAFRYNW